MKRRLIEFLVATACLSFLVYSVNAAETHAKPDRKIIRAEDGLNIVCEVSGKGDVALIFLHGWCGDHEYWKNQVEAFDAEYRIITLDQAGHGESGKNREHWTINALAQDVESVVKALDLKRVILVGHSMGGPIALEAAKRMPGKIIAVIGVDTLQDAEFKMPEEVSKQFLGNFETDFKGTMRFAFDSLVAEKTNSELKNWLLSRAEVQDQKMALPLIRDLISLDTRAQMKEAHVPIRCINSGGGYQLFRPTAVETNRKYADYKAVIIDEVGHYPMLEKPAEFNEKLRNVLKEFGMKK